jgi:hypothetical protein
MLRFLDFLNLILNLNLTLNLNLISKDWRKKCLLPQM